MNSPHNEANPVSWVSQGRCEVRSSFLGSKTDAKKRIRLGRLGVYWSVAERENESPGLLRKPKIECKIAPK